MRQLRTVKGLGDLIPRYRSFFFDLDGVVWLSQQPIPTAVRAIHNLYEHNKLVYFISNSSARARTRILDRLAAFGFPVQPHHIYNSAITTGIYIKKNDPSIRKVLVLGSHSLAEEMRQAGLQAQLCNLEGPTTSNDFKTLQASLDSSIQAVVAGVDYNMNYKKLCLASLYLQRGLPLYATNPDRHVKVGGSYMPGAGSVVCQLEFVSNKKATIIGKPNPFILDYLIAGSNIKKEECIMVGDNLNTDIKFANAGGIDSLCTMTGVTGWEEAEKDPTRATFYCQHL